LRDFFSSPEEGFGGPFYPLEILLKMSTLVEREERGKEEG
jgi:hypothetical protein